MEVEEKNRSQKKSQTFARSYNKKELMCQYMFREAIKTYGHLWHVCTPGNLIGMYNISEDDYRFSVSNMAISAFEAGVRVVTDAQMEDHIHALVGGTKDQCLTLIKSYSYRLNKHLTMIGRPINLKNFRCDNPIEIKDLEMMRNEIAYINRNGFVVNSQYTPFSYPWGSGYLYFNPAAQREYGIKYNDLNFNERRKLCMRRVVILPDKYQVKNGMILPSSYADYQLGQSMFRDAHHYLSAIIRNIEAYSEEAKMLGDLTVLSREEMYQAAKMLSMRDYNITQPSLLPYQAKIMLARTMHFDYNASNAQIRSILNIPESLVDAMFPLKKSK